MQTLSARPVSASSIRAAARESALAADMAGLGQLAPRSRLRRLGHTDAAMRAAVDRGILRSVGRSWLAAPGVEPAAVRAIELRGFLGGESALRSMGVWVSHDTGLCVATPHSASRLSPVGEGEYRVQARRPPQVDDARPWRASAIDALEHLLRREPEAAHGIASVDSAVRLGLLPAHRVDELFDRLPRRLRRLRRDVNGLADSGVETLLRLAALAQGWRVEVQVQVSSVGRVDLLIDGWLIVEVDGYRWHSSAQQVAVDHRRDAESIRRGMRYHRFGYDQVMTDIDGCIGVLRELLRCGRPSRG
ncbi:MULTISPECIES: endonuclease domain-containing protein [unclassified Leifsonia]|uniref:endonuclease domain-containing protein n=1 Tax=unclassified Leifsonia TaxID=2663824 RepID=UPI0006F6DC34|nr:MULTISPECIES: hypothetical protein [unclassified Leifsonia]KQX08023.1 hypothetical protein ASC59_10045 [Leifsonia sp. Root1293]KRA12304.1 hypothetical protein ASD61_10045 [Leifsonia sp. Root60]